MSNASYAADSSMRDARAQYFQANAFGEDGGYNASWVVFKLGPIPLTIPNTAGRKRAVAYHDLHHIVTGYGTDFSGEFEISSWEVGAGCGSTLAIWVINLGGMAGGVLFAPARTFAAFCLGRRTRTLYDRELSSLLDQTVEATRRDCGLDPPPQVTPGLRDAAAYALAALLGLITGTAMFIFGLAATPVVLALSARRSARA